MRSGRLSRMRGALAAIGAAAVTLLPACGQEPDAGATRAGHEGHGAGEQTADRAPGAPPSAAGDSAPGQGPHAVVELPLGREQVFGVRVVPAVVEDLSRTLRTTGVVRTDETRESTVRTKWSGWIHDVSVAFVGQSVRRGDVLFRVYSPELVVAQEEYLASLRRREALGPAPDETRAKEAALSAASARERLRLWDVPESVLERLEATGRAERIVPVLAPRDGTVLVRSALPGATIGPDAELYSIADLSVVWVIADLYEFEAPFAREGTAATFLPVGSTRAQVPSTIAFVSPTVDEMTRTVKVRLEVPNPDGALRPGAYGVVTLTVPLGRGVVVPSDAVIDSGTRTVLFVRTRPGVFEPRQVRLGARAGDRLLVLEGLSAGEEVVVRGQFLLDSESRLRAAGSASPGHDGH